MDLVRPPTSFLDGGTYLGRLPFTKYDQYISAVSIISFPRFSFPYSTGVNEMKKLVPLLPNLAS